MEMLLIVTTDAFEVPTFYLKSCAVQMLFNFCTDSENKMGKKYRFPQKRPAPPHRQKIKNNRVILQYLFKPKKSEFFNLRDPYLFLCLH